MNAMLGCLLLAGLVPVQPGLPELIPDPAPFTLELAPTLVQMAIPGQHCVLLVQVTDDGTGPGHGEPVNLSATAPGAEIIIAPQVLPPGRVAEVTVIPGAANVGQPLPVTVRGERSGIEQTASIRIEIVAGNIGEFEGSIGPPAAKVRDRFVGWLAQHHPELNITSQTEWTGVVVSPYIWVVTHHLFFSEEWELHVAWHVMIPPHDWAQIDLRRRFNEIRPSQAFKLDARGVWSQEPYAIDPPTEVWR